MAAYIALFLPDANKCFFYMFSTIHPYLSLLFSHIVFLFTPSFSYSMLDSILEIKNTNIIIFGTKYELFIPRYLSLSFIAFGQAKIFFNNHILMNILIDILFCDKKSPNNISYRKTFQKKKRTRVNKNIFLILSWRRPLSYRNQSIDLQSKSMDWFLYDNGLRHERVTSWKSS